MDLIQFIIFFTVLSTGIILVYFPLFAPQRERFILHSGFSWLAYLLSLLCVIVAQYTDLDFVYGLRETCDMLNIVFLMFSAFAFVRLEISSYWIQATLIFILWLFISSIYQMDIYTIFLPVAGYELLCTFVICRTVLKYWTTSLAERIFVTALFSIWGAVKAIAPIAIRYDEMPAQMYFVEILFYNLLFYSIIIVYMYKSVDRLTRSEKNFRVITENVTDIIFFYSRNPAPAFTYVSPSAETMTGYPLRDFYADSRFYLKLVGAEDFERISKVFSFDENQGAGGGGGAGAAGDSLVCRMIRGDGKPFWAEIKRVPLYEDGKASAVVGVIRDISPMKDAEEELVESKLSRERLFSYISHELRLPLSSIIGYLDAIQNGTIAASGKDEALSVIGEKAHFLNHIIDDLAQLSQIETGRFAFNYMLCDVGDLAEGMIESHSNDVTGKNLKFINHLEHPSRARRNVVADPERVSQVLSNLITNAAKFSDSVSEITVIFDIDNAEGCFTVAVSDRGKGISARDLPRIFNRFFTKSSEVSGHPGTGLGLTLSKEIAEAHKGSLRVFSVEGRGSTFTLSIPLYGENRNRG